MPDHAWTIPEDRIILDHDKDLPEEARAAQVEGQLAAIVAFARSKAGAFKTSHAVEIVYKTPADLVPTAKQLAEFDAVLVDLREGEVIETLPPYDSIDPDWRSKRS